jgi:glycosyltransferase involved in cell wall biosynthesis
MPQIKLSVVMPVFNEASTIQEIVAQVLAAPFAKELVIVDDYSTDGTRDVLRQLASNDSIRVLFHERNQGKGAALRTGFAAASGDVVLVQDADLEYDPNEYPKLLEPILAGKADVVYGSRFVGGDSHRVLYFWHYLGNKALTLLSNALTNLNLTDMETCYKVFRREVLRQITVEEQRFGFEPEVTGKIAAIPDCRIYEVGISYSGRTYEQGKKIGWRDGVRAAWCIWKYRPSRMVKRRLATAASAPRTDVGPIAASELVTASHSGAAGAERAR